MDLIVRQATEAGLRRLIPVFSRYSQVRYSDRQGAQRKLERWPMNELIFLMPNNQKIWHIAAFHRELFWLILPFKIMVLQIHGETRL